ncbi:MAG TPA: Smr/MutS family protein [Smithellaceae bacterium]|nr:Smr/MutS family protein [Smithellaceae bacterium]
MAAQKKKVANIISEQSPLGHNPFDGLKGLMKNKASLPSSSDSQAVQKKYEPAPSQPSEDQLFREAMKGVHPIPGERAPREPVAIKVSEKKEYFLENDALSRLAKLVHRGEGFVVSDTPEYMEGIGYNAREEFAHRLHRGDFSISGHIDLHGMNVETAREAFEAFMKASYLAGKGAVLVIHGRGLSSPGEAILKNKVREWLSSSYWRKRVLAFASAQSYDGGAGATYVLLRDRPVSKKSPKAKTGD